jgi:hypothetical protein
MALLKLPCLAMVNAWAMRSNAVRSQSAAGSRASRVMIDLRLPPTPLPSHRDAPNLPGSPPWVNRVERLQLQRASGGGPAPLAPSSLLSTTHDNPSACPLHPVTFPPPAVSRDASATHAHMTPRAPSYILAAKQKCERRQSPPGGRRSEQGAAVEVTAAATPVQIALLDDRFRMTPSPKQETRPDSHLYARCAAGNSSPNDAEAASLPGLQEDEVAMKDLSRCNMGTLASVFAHCIAHLLVE